MPPPLTPPPHKRSKLSLKKQKSSTYVYQVDDNDRHESQSILEEQRGEKDKIPEEQRGEKEKNPEDQRGNDVRGEKEKRSNLHTDPPPTAAAASANASTADVALQALQVN